MKISPLTLSIFLILTQISSAFVANTSMIIDLEATDLPEFLTEASSWALSNTICPSCNQTFTTPPNTCNMDREMVYGGPNILGPSGGSTTGQYYRRVFPGMPNLQYAAATFDFWIFLSGGGSGLTPQVRLNGVPLVLGGAPPMLSCSLNYQVGPGVVVGYMYKYSVFGWFYMNAGSGSSSSLTFDVISQATTPSDDFSLGIRNLKIYNMNSPPSSIFANFPCVQDDGWNGISCVSCHTNCKSCYGPSKNECTVCRGAYYNYNNGSCLGQCNSPFISHSSGGQNLCVPKCPDSYFWASNSSCSPSCDPPFEFSIDQNNLTLCSNPCYGTGKFLYPNGSCFSQCNDPLNRKYSPQMLCLNPCSTENLYLYNNQSCFATCPLPLLTWLTPGISYCYNPCGSTGQYLYPNGSCLPSCGSNLISQSDPGVRYCRNPCQPSEYIYPNGSCYAACLLPLRIRTIPDFNFCYNPCIVSTQFLYLNGSCFNNCPAPLVSQTEPAARFCRNLCQPSEYLYPNGSCFATCVSPLRIRSTPDTNFCYNPCQMSQFLYPNSSCESSCNSPLITQTEPIGKFCRNLCQPSEYLFTNGSCLASCPQPLSIRTTPDTNYCENPCDISTQYLFDDGSCETSCDPPLLPINEPQVRYCRNPCYGTSNYLYPNHSCIAVCPLPLFSRTEPPLNYKYCENPCYQNSTFLDFTQTCQTLCPAPLIIRREDVANFCLHPCENPNDYLFVSTGKCQATCDSPFTAIDSARPKLCTSSLSEEEVKQVKQMAAATSTAGTAADTGVMVFSVVSSSDSTAVCMGPIAKMLQYIKFMNINFPEKVVLMLQQQSENANSGGVTGKVMGGVLKKFPDHKLPQRFTAYKMHSSFFVNYWPTLFNLVVILLVTFAAMILVWQTKNSPKVNGIMQSVLEVLKWNVVLITFCGSLGDVMLFTALEFQTMQFDNFEAVLSFLLCLTMNLLAIFVVVKILEVNSIIRKSKKNSDFSDNQIEKQWCSYKALFECYRDSSYYQQIFLFVFIIRMALFNGIIGYLYNYPLFQAVIFMLSNVLMLGYLIIKRPMRKLISLIQQAILEFVLLPFNACVLALAIMDKQGIEAINIRKSIGNVIFYINLAVPFLSLALMVVKFVAIGIEFYQQRKAAKLNMLKKFNIEVSRQTTKNNTTLNTTQDIILPTQTSPSQAFNKKITGLSENNTQNLDTVENSYFERSPENSLIFLKPRRNPTIPRNNRVRPRFHHPELILPDVPIEQPAQPMTFLNENSGFQHAQNEISVAQNEMSMVQNEPQIMQNERRRIKKKQRRGNIPNGWEASIF